MHARLEDSHEVEKSVKLDSDSKQENKFLLKEDSFQKSISTFPCYRHHKDMHQFLFEARMKRKHLLQLVYQSRQKQKQSKNKSSK